VINTETRFKAEGRRQKAEGRRRKKKEGTRKKGYNEITNFKLLTSNFWYGIAIPLIT
jgi:hypothetical protein